VYSLGYPRATPKWPAETEFYVGKGALSRGKFHLSEAANLNDKGKNRVKIAKIRRIVEVGDNVIIKILHRNLSNYEASLLEIFYIAKYGRANLSLGPLTNLTNGGDGGQGVIHDEKARRNMSEVQKIVNKRPEVILNKSESQKRTNRNNPDIVIKRGLAIKQGYAKPSAKRMGSINARTPQARAKGSATLKITLQDPAMKKKWSVAQKIAQNKPEVNAKRSQSLKNSNKILRERLEADPEAKALEHKKRSDAAKACCARRKLVLDADPVAAQKAFETMSTAVKEGWARRQKRLKANEPAE